jgi:hypothetical protein
MTAKQGLGDVSLAPGKMVAWFEKVQMTQLRAYQWTPSGKDSTKECSFNVTFECNALDADLVWLDSAHLAPATITIVPHGLFIGIDGPIRLDTIVAQERTITHYSDQISQGQIGAR